jgi:hypothetical protein
MRHNLSVGQRVSTTFFAPNDPDAVDNMVTRYGTITRIDPDNGQRNVWVDLEQPRPFARHLTDVQSFDFFASSLEPVSE